MSCLPFLNPCLPPPPPALPPQMYAFCNADDISWGTKNLDTKHSDHDARKMASKALAYQVRAGCGREQSRSAVWCRWTLMLFGREEAGCRAGQ